MDLLKPIVKHWTYDWYLRRDYLSVRPHLRELNQSQFFTPARIADLQMQRLREVLQFAFLHNDFHRQRFDAAGFSPDQLKDFADLRKLPILTKEDIRRAGDRLFSNGYHRENTIHKRTGGSTGVPLHVYMDRPAFAYKKAAAMRSDGWAGWSPGVRLAGVWGDTEKPVPFKEWLRNHLSSRTFYLDTLKFDETRRNRFLAQIRRQRPAVMMGHAHSIFRLAEWLEHKGAEDVRFKGIITTAMVLSPEERRTIERVFRSPVFNRYGCEEISLIASESEEHNGLHIFAEGVYVELEGSGDGGGKLIITDLLNRAMPMIRYEIGDWAIADDSPILGPRGLPRLGEISGRTADFLYTPERQPVFGISILDTFLIHIPGLKQVQIIQNDYDNLDFRIVKGEGFSDDSLRMLATNVEAIFSPRMQYRIRYVDRIEQSERGKFRFSICNIRQGRPA